MPPAPSIRLGSLTRCLIAIGRKRCALEERLGKGSARFAAMHPDSLARIRREGELVYASNSRSFEQIVGLELVADEALPRGVVEVRAAHAIDGSAAVSLPARSAGHVRPG